MQLGHLVVAVLSAAVGAAALVATWLLDDWWSPGTLLGVVLLLNAAVRLQMARR